MSNTKSLIETGGTDKPARKPKKGKNQLPDLKTPEDYDLSSRVLTSILTEATQPRVTSNEELFDRFKGYFMRCIEQQKIPTVEECMISTGYSCDYMNMLRTGSIHGPQWSTEETPKIISWAFEVIRAYDAGMVNAGKLPQIPYIFRSKNFYGMSDRPEVVIPVRQDEDEISAEEIAKRYAVEGHFADEDEAKK